jgi:uncharacterized PurR-regulated membrane protein YhhQ (DUF165 family)
LYWALNLEIHQVISIMIFAYAYKAFFSLANTPLFYAIVYYVKKKGTLPMESS